MSARPWRVEYHLGAGEWHREATWASFAIPEKLAVEVQRWKKYSGTTREYRLVNRDTAEVIHV